jgi:Arc/MetJ family transcription regulator
MEGAMRTNIEIDDKLMKRAMKASGASTKKAVVQEALEILVRMKTQGDIIRSLRGIGWDGDLEKSRLAHGEE